MTRAELFEAAAKMMRMCDEAGVAYAYKHEGDLYSMEPSLSDSAEKYEFPLAIVEGRPVFNNDTMYHSALGKVTVVRRLSDITDSSHVLIGIDNAWCFSWNPPRKTFMLNGEELPHPKIIGRTYYADNCYGIDLKFDNRADRDSVEAAIHKLLENK